MNTLDLTKKTDAESFYTYMTTNFNKTVIYTGSTIDLIQRLYEHYINQGLTNSFTAKYKAFYCIWYQEFKTLGEARDREAEIKSLNRAKKRHSSMKRILSGIF